MQTSQSAAIGKAVASIIDETVAVANAHADICRNPVKTRGRAGESWPYVERPGVAVWKAEAHARASEQEREQDR